MNKLILLCLLLFVGSNLIAQDKVFETFKDTRVINTHSVETLQKRQIDFRIGHRFGDLFGDRGGWSTFYGLENAADVYFGFDFGLSDKLTVGISRTKGAGQLKQLVNGTVKYRVLQQSTGEQSMPISLTALGILSYSTMAQSDRPEAINRFEKGAHRMVYAVQLLIARKFSNRFSLQIVPSYVHRNVVPFGDSNDLFSLGVAGRLQLTKALGIILDTTLPLSGSRPDDTDYYVPLGIGLEFDTGGHVFQINFTNSMGIVATDYIPYTTSNWLDNQFRLGFTISRIFNI